MLLQNKRLFPDSDGKISDLPHKKGGGIASIIGEIILRYCGCFRSPTSSRSRPTEKPKPTAIQMRPRPPAHSAKYYTDAIGYPQLNAIIENLESLPLRVRCNAIDKMVHFTKNARAQWEAGDRGDLPAID
ncbi:uncharacterized protein LOC135840784 [Planococcus citri]|uniref:uncharacterized protein LOC135840784 n=1 Tax=Planococcus citri TaxID=170843 RepID=UPI0031F946C7